MKEQPLHLSITLASLAFLLLRKVGLSSKHPYSVTLKGEPLWWTGPKGAIEEIGGFYTTRWVMAPSHQEASARAVRMVKKEVQRFMQNPPGSPLCMEIEECLKLDGFLTWRGGGFTFWAKDEAQFYGYGDDHPDGAVLPGSCRPNHVANEWRRIRINQRTCLARPGLPS